MIPTLCIGMGTWKKVLKGGFAPPSSPLSKQCPLLSGLRSLFTELQPASGPPVLPGPSHVPCLLPAEAFIDLEGVTWKLSAVPFPRGHLHCERGLYRHSGQTFMWEEEGEFTKTSCI